MSDLHSIEEAYEAIADAMNYLKEHGERTWPNEGVIEGNSYLVVWSNQKRKFEAYQRKLRKV